MLWCLLQCGLPHRGSVAWPAIWRLAIHDPYFRLAFTLVAPCWGGEYGAGSRIKGPNVLSTLLDGLRLSPYSGASTAATVSAVLDYRLVEGTAPAKVASRG